MTALQNDSRVVLTLDAGGTNFVFSAIKGGVEIVEPIILPSSADNLNNCLRTIVDGFNQVKWKCSNEPVAISFAFPGPADYANGIIGDLNNLPAFKGGVALGPMLQEIFGIPVFINNDGDLFVYGEAIAGLLPKINQQLANAGSSKRYKNLFGFTLGTGFGGGLVVNNKLYLGDNGAGAEVWLLRNKKYNTFIEESASIRAIINIYNQKTTIKNLALQPKDIYEIAMGNTLGDKDAALFAFAEMAEIVGDAIANAVTITDSLVVMGGGLSGSAGLLLPGIVKEMNSKFISLNNKKIDRLELKAFNLDDTCDFAIFAKGAACKIDIPGTSRHIDYDPLKRTGIGVSVLGTSKAISIGAYAYALDNL